MEQLAVIYFSGTGNTRYIANLLAKRLSAAYRTDLYDLAAIGNAEKILRGADVVLLAFPIYGSAPPIPMRDLVCRYSDLFAGKRVILAETQYFYSMDGAASLGRAIEKRGGKIIAAQHFNMPNNLADCKVFAVKNGGENAKKLERARKRADEFADRILAGKAPKKGFGLLSHAAGYFSQRKFWRKREHEKRSKLKVDPARCVGCGLCVKECPVSNLTLSEGHASGHGICVLCYRCVNKCPRRAITILGAAPPEKQYRGPD